jgi:hypothetical protein
MSVYLLKKELCKLNLNKSQSFNTFAEVLLGSEHLEKLFNEENIKKWDKLSQEWVRIIYENSNKNKKY